jgi:predicted acylesterase/phospholipase RssA
MSKLKTNDVNYLAFEGGGGKGIAYLGAVKALEEVFDQKPLIDLKQDIGLRKLQGISGSSAGSITAFMLALGMSSDEIKKLIDKIIDRTTGNDISNANNEQIKEKGITPFENFFSDPQKEKLSLRNFNTNSSEYILPKIYPETESDEEKVKTLIQIIGREGYPYIFSLLFAILKKSQTSDIWFKQLFLHENDSVSGIIKPIYDGLSNSVLDKLSPSSLERIIWESILQELKIETNRTVFADYFYNFYKNFGLFSGFEVRKYFADLIQEKIINAPPDSIPGTIPPETTKPEDITFQIFYGATKVDLRITGVNISTQKAEYFSFEHTPNFPVMDAVAISMNLPLFFKPFYIEGKVNIYENDEYNEKYRGLWVDGGVLNNYPLHAFDSYTVNKDGKPINSDKLPNNVLGLRLSDGIYKEQKSKKPESYDLGRYVSELIGSIMSPSEEGQIRTSQERDQTIELFTEEISVTDFSNPNLDKAREAKIETEGADGGVDNLEDMKNRVINRAHETVLGYFDMLPESKPTEPLSE